ncbi:MAG: hypothetical protein N2F24_05320, partial [Deltaproteobacteria bacterium]
TTINNYPKQSLGRKPVSKKSHKKACPQSGVLFKEFYTIHRGLAQWHVPQCGMGLAKGKVNLHQKFAPIYCSRKEQ